MQDMRTHQQAAMLLVCLAASSTLLLCSAEPSILPSPAAVADVSNATSPIPDSGVALNMTLDDANATDEANTTELAPSAQLRAVAVPEGDAVVDLPYPRNLKNTSDLNSTDNFQASDDTGYGASGSQPPGFYQASLSIHNNYRSQHQNTPQMVWDDTVARSAGAYASRCIWGHDPNNKQYGENLYAYSLDNDKAKFQETGLKAW